MALEEKKCTPCEGGTPPLTNEKENELLREVPWEIDRNGIHRIRKLFTLKNFRRALDFVNRVGVVAEEEQHHPDIHISYKKVTIELYTHTVKGLSENDFILASKIERVAAAHV